MLNRTFLQGSYYALWTLGLGVFLFFGARHLPADLRDGAPLKPRKYATSDIFLGPVFGVANATEGWLTVLNRLPPKGEIVYVCPKGTARWDLNCGVISYLSWPRRVRREEVDESEVEDKTVALRYPATAAIVFCVFQPPPRFDHGWRLGPEFVVVPLEAER